MPAIADYYCRCICGAHFSFNRYLQYSAVSNTKPCVYLLAIWFLSVIYSADSFAVSFIVSGTQGNVGEVNISSESNRICVKFEPVSSSRDSQSLPELLKQPLEYIHAPLTAVQIALPRVSCDIIGSNTAQLCWTSIQHEWTGYCQRSQSFFQEERQSCLSCFNALSESKLLDVSHSYVGGLRRQVYSFWHILQNMLASDIPPNINTPFFQEVLISEPVFFHVSIGAANLQIPAVWQMQSATFLDALSLQLAFEPEPQGQTPIIEVALYDNNTPIPLERIARLTLRINGQVVFELRQDSQVESEITVVKIERDDSDSDSPPPPPPSGGSFGVLTQ